MNEDSRGGKSRPVACRARPFIPDELSDIELLRAHVGGQRHAFAEILRRHNDHLWQTALRTSYTREDAADSLQDALLSAHRTAGSFRAEAEVRSWLHAIVVNACLDRIRRNKTRRAISLSPETMPEPVDDRDEFAELEMSLVVDRALFSLPPDQRTALVAIDLEGYSVADAAAMLGVPEGTIKSRCARARQRLQERLEFLRDPGNRK
ncbi:RNA polymerase sigma factor SigM [Nocardia sp. NEAU-351]|uniref:RNA polymerase sigma factor SigM n=1 Tax=Nocardia bovistercoris TaxID=2785916 RepID=A0A931IKD2_9NOCA|nr:RNA polymerase sigma factor SigM [Nocardia bovistercoris]